MDGSLEKIVLVELVSKYAKRRSEKTPWFEVFLGACCILFVRT